MGEELVDFSNIFSPIGQDLENRKQKIERSNNLRLDEQFHFRNKPDWLLGLYKKIDEYCIGLKAGTKKTILQTYIRWTYRGKMFCRVFFFRTSLKIYLKLKYSELENPPAFIRDYTDIAKGTTIEILLNNKEEYLQNEEAFFAIISSLIEKSFLGVTGARKLGPVKRRKLEPVKTIEAVRPSSVNISVGENGYLNINLKIHKSQKEILNRILQKTIFK